jgi:hypothetical protein
MSFAYWPHCGMTCDLADIEPLRTSRGGIAAQLDKAYYVLAGDMADIWHLWPDGFMCPCGETFEYPWKSDDYMRVHVTAYGEDGEPTTWHRMP